MSSYIFKICQRLSSRYQSGVPAHSSVRAALTVLPCLIKDSRYCVEQKLLEEIWMFAYELNEENFPRRSFKYTILNYFLVSSDREIEEYFT